MLAMETQTPRGIRQPASSFKTIAGKPQDVQSTQKPVGASLLAMEAQTLQGIRQPSSSLTTIAGKPSPTGAGQAAGCAVDTKTCGSELARDGGPDTAGHQTASVIVQDHREQGSLLQWAGQAAGCAVDTKTCGSELARDGGTDTAGSQAALIIVHDHRDGSTHRQARSYRNWVRPAAICTTTYPLPPRLPQDTKHP